MPRWVQLKIELKLYVSTLVDNVVSQAEANKMAV
jgi:hypothetical protein